MIDPIQPPSEQPPSGADSSDQRIGPAPQEDEALAFAESENVAEPGTTDAAEAGEGVGGWEPNVRARTLSVELRRIEFEIRELLKYGDIKRKRKYEGTRRWMELLEDIVAMRYTGQVSDEALKRVAELVAKRQQLFRELNFVVATRHRWNT
ncbi:MAG: hypothetical protein BroJett003_20190 [Planctomycetota bacterium]|nr:MAG: hypothetical protein BroJett003_20190 [Planctomycetota bacterium]